MKIVLIIEHNPYFSASASANRWLSLIEGLKKLDVEMFLLIYGEYQCKRESDEWSIAGSKNGIIYKYLNPKFSSGYYTKRFNRYIGDNLKIGKLVKASMYEIENQEGIIWTDSCYFGFKLAVHLKKQLPERRIFLEMSEFLDIHNYNKGNFLQRWKGNKRHRFFDKTAFHAYSGIALMTKTLYNHYEQFPAPKPHLLHLPMTADLERFSQSVEALPGFEKPYISFVGVMNDAKDGVNILISAFTKIAEQFPKYKLYLIGPWQYDTPNHLKMIKEFGLSDRIFWKKEYPRDSIPAIIKNADLLVLPRPDSKQAKGGFPTKLGEYLATGNPVCATTVGEIPDYLVDGESVYFAEPGSVDSFADAMRCTLSNPAEAKRIGANGRKVAETHFNKDIQAKKLYQFLSDLTQKS